MKIKTILIAGVLPLALFAKDDDMAGKIVPRLVDSKNTELNQTIDGINDFAPEEKHLPSENSTSTKAILLRKSPSLARLRQRPRSKKSKQSPSKT